MVFHPAFFAPAIDVYKRQVVEGAETLSVGFCDSTACEAKVKGYDSEKDLAVVAVSLDDIDSDTMDAITIATIGNSDDLKVGAQVVACLLYTSTEEPEPALCMRILLYAGAERSQQRRGTGFRYQRE